MRMKKYLITGALTLSLGGFLTSCHDSEIDYSSIAEAKQATFAENFVKFYGEIDPNQDWGFGESTSSVRTRGVNADANEWAASDGEKWKVPPALTDAQKNIVRIYFQSVKDPKYEDPQWTDYFIQQVYKGGTTPGSNSPEKYKAADNRTDIVGSDNMDHLAAINGTFVDHNYNFNHGDYPNPYPNVLDYTAEKQYTKNENSTHHHSDQIELMVNSTTKSFGYFNSAGSVRRTEYTGLVSYETIKKWADANGHAGEADCLNDGWERRFMGFDFELMIDEEMYATGDNAYATYAGPATEGRIWDGTNVTNTIAGYDQDNGWAPIWAEGYEHMMYNGAAVRCLSSDQNSYAGDFIEYTSDDDIVINIDGYGKCLNMKKINDDLLSKGYLPVAGGNLKKWVKVGGTADHYYSDWIVTLTKAEHYGTPTTTPTTGGSTEYNESTTGTYRRRYVQNHKWVFCEDLGQASNKKDFDYNDLVFDAKIVQDYIVTITDGIEVSVVSNGDPYALITPLAAGGELTITVAGQNVHQMFGQGDATIINTIDADKESDVRSSGVSYAPQSAGRIDCQQTATYATSNILDIPINVRIYNEAFTTLAQKGKAPHKIAVTPGTRWAQERVDIDTAQPGFAEWVRDVTVGATFWKKEESENRYPYMPTDEYLTNDMTGKYLPDEYISVETTKTYGISPSNTEKLVWSDLTGNSSFTSTWDTYYKVSYTQLAQNDPNGKAFGVGSVIRAYIIANDGYNIQMHSEDASYNWTQLAQVSQGSNDSHISNGSGYFEYTVTSNALAALKTGNLQINGINGILLGVTVDNTNAASTSTTLFSATPTTTWSVPGGTTDAEITSSYATITGGSMYVTNSTNDAKNLIRSRGNEMAFCQTNNDTFFKVTLSSALQAGDIISVRMETRKETDLGLWFKNTNSRGSEPTAKIVLAKAQSQAWVDAPTYIVAEGDEICGKSTFYIYRHTPNNTYFNTLTITRQ